jgi:NAD-dependent deacetylase
MENTDENYAKAIQLLTNSRYTSAFTGAGISVESGIPPFRGEGGIWTKYDPMYLDIEHYISQTEKSWKIIREIFYDFFGDARPNMAHYGLSLLERKGRLKNVITQNIDNLHLEAGNKVVIEFHGNSKYFRCLRCGKKFSVKDITLSDKPPHCAHCEGLLKPDFIFFGEGIPEDAYKASLKAAQHASVFLLIGTSGQVAPANQIPYLAKQNGASIIEINPDPSAYTYSITDIFLRGKAAGTMETLMQRMFP